MTLQPYKPERTRTATVAPHLGGITNSSTTTARRGSACRGVRWRDRHLRLIFRNGRQGRWSETNIHVLAHSSSSSVGIIQLDELRLNQRRWCAPPWETRAAPVTDGAVLFPESTDTVPSPSGDYHHEVMADFGVQCRGDIHCGRNNVEGSYSDDGQDNVVVPTNTFNSSADLLYKIRTG